MLAESRVKARERKWSLYTPNRFLRQHVSWFTEENLKKLQSLVHSPEAAQTKNEKVFEFLFALELCNSADSQFFHDNLGISPLDKVTRSITSVDVIAECTDWSKIYILKESERTECRCNVIFFAHNSALHTVRVLVQLSASSQSIEEAKIHETLTGMRSLKSIYFGGLAAEDRGLFIAPCLDYTYEPGESVPHTENGCKIVD